jgi:hypothetical protein
MNSRLPGRPRRALAPIVDQLDSRQLLSSLGLPVHGPLPIHGPVLKHHHNPAHPHQPPDAAKVARGHDPATTGRAGADAAPPVEVGLGAVTSQVNLNGELLSTSAVSAADVWAVGGTLVEHFNGTSWSVVPTATLPAGDGASFGGVTALASDNVWAVGKLSGGSTTTPLIEHFNGTVWSVVASPTVSDGSLNAVSAITASNIWAVGTSFFGGNLTEHFNGTSWSVVSSPNPPGVDNLRLDSLTAVSGDSASDVWAVGRDQDGRNSTGPEILHFNGTAWSVVQGNGVNNPIPNPTFDAQGITAVSPTNVWAVGNIVEQVQGGPSPEVAAIAHFNGKTWSIVTSPSIPNTFLDAATAVSADDIWAVGGQETIRDQQVTSSKTLVEHFDGTSWSVVASANSPTTAGTFNGLAGVTALADGTVVAVGSTTADSINGTSVEHPLIIRN